MTTATRTARPTEILDVMPTECGGVPVVEMQLREDGIWNCLSNRGYVWCIARPRFVQVVQGESVVIRGVERRQRWLTVEDGEIANSYDTLEQATAAAARAAHPMGARGWQWSGGRPVNSLAEAERNYWAAAQSAANGAAMARMQGR